MKFAPLVLYGMCKMVNKCMNLDCPEASEEYVSLGFAPKVPKPEDSPFLKLFLCRDCVDTFSAEAIADGFDWKGSFLGTFENTEEGMKAAEIRRVELQKEKENLNNNQ